MPDGIAQTTHCASADRLNSYQRCLSFTFYRQRKSMSTMKIRRMSAQCIEHRTGGLEQWAFQITSWVFSFQLLKNHLTIGHNVLLLRLLRHLRDHVFKIISRRKSHLNCRHSSTCTDVFRFHRRRKSQRSPSLNKFFPNVYKTTESISFCFSSPVFQVQANRTFHRVLSCSDYWLCLFALSEVWIRLYLYYDYYTNHFPVSLVLLNDI